MSTFSNPLTEYSPQMELESAARGEFDDAFEHGIFDEHQQMELAVALLEVGNEEQLDRFLGGLIRKASNKIGSTVKPSLARPIGDLLKTVVRHVLPISVRAEIVRGPLGAQLGKELAAVAGQALGLELEGLSQEDREFEAVRQFVRFADETVKNAEETAPGTDPADVAHRAAVEAAQIYAPGLMIEQRQVRQRNGRWVSRRA